MKGLYSDVPGGDLRALAAEAGRRGISYGQLVAGTTPEQQRAIVLSHEERAPERRVSTGALERSREENRHKGGRKAQHDKDRAMELYIEGKTDGEIEKIMGTCHGWATVWRNKNGLPSQQELQWARWDEKMEELYAQGLSDGEIAAGAGASASTVCRWRQKNGLPPNVKPGGQAKRRKRGAGKA